MFQQRLPAGDYDFAMFIQVTSPDPSVTSVLSSAQIPSAANKGTGQNDFWYSNTAADAVMSQSDTEATDKSRRVDEIHQLDKILRQDYVTLPLYAIPSLAAWRADRVAGPIDADINSPESIFWNIYAWTLRP